MYLTYANVSDLTVENQSPPSSCSRVDIFGDTDNNRLFFWNGIQNNLLYPSTFVSEASLEESRGYLPASVPLYVPEGSSCVLGDGQYPITGFVRQYDRMLIYTTAETWMTDTDNLSERKFVAKPIHPHIGCATIDACSTWKNTPITVDESGIYRFTADTDEYDESNAISICDSEDIDEDDVAHEIVAEYHSHILEYDTPALKHFRELVLCADCDGGSITVSLHGDRIGEIRCTFSGEGSHSILSRRLSSGRFRYATLSLRADGAAKQTVYSLISDVR